METRHIKIDGYRVIQEHCCAEENKLYEGIFAQGNGYLHVRGSFEEGLSDAPQNELYTRSMKSVTTEVQRHPLSKQGTFLPLIMGKHPFLEEVIINLPYFMDIVIYADGEKLDMLHSSISEYARVLDMKNGETTRSVQWKTRSGCLLQLKFRRFASAVNQHLFMQDVAVSLLEGNCQIKILSGIDADITTNGYNHFETIQVAPKENGLFCNVTTDVQEEVTMYSINQLLGSSLSQTFDQKERRCSTRYEGTLIQGSEVELVKYTVIGCSRDQEENQASKLWQEVCTAADQTYEKLLEQHSQIWMEKWDRSDIKIKGYPLLQDSIRFSIYHLLRCNNGSEERIQVCAKGFAGEAYYGRYFWDSEIFLLPFYIHTNPQAAKSLLAYRYHTLEGARENARRYHCSGARFPWQSGLTGTEQCSLWEYADNEVHVTADIAFGIMHYYQATKDWDFIREKGLEILLETAKFWVDRVDWDDDLSCHLINVMGPDEYSPMTRDNGFTNRMVIYHLTSSLDMLEQLKTNNPEQYDPLMKKLHMSEENLLEFQNIAQQLSIPYDTDRGLYLQSSDFEEYPAICLDDYWEDKNKAFGYYVTQEKIYRTRCIKQADTIALMTLFEDEFTNKEVETAYDYYKPLTTHDSSLSPAVHTLAANRIGRTDEVWEFVKKTIGVDLDIARQGAEDGIHIANCGALWQLIIQGFAGVKPAYIKSNLVIEPRLPEFIEEIEFPLCWQGKEYYVHVDHGQTMIEER